MYKSLKSLEILCSAVFRGGSMTAIFREKLSCFQITLLSKNKRIDLSESTRHILTLNPWQTFAVAALKSRHYITKCQDTKEFCQVLCVLWAVSGACQDESQSWMSAVQTDQNLSAATSLQLSASSLAKLDGKTVVCSLIQEDIQAHEESY